MIFYKDIIEVSIKGKNLFKVKLAEFLLRIQSQSFESIIRNNKGKKVIFYISISAIDSLRITSKSNDCVTINLNLNSPYKLSLAYLLQIWALINNSLIVHGGIYCEKKSNFILTGEGGVGKTHKIITACMNNKQPFMGDDLLLLDGLNAYPIIRPLCIYPEHGKIQKLNTFISKKIKERNVFFLKVKRKVLAYISALFPRFDFLYLNSYENEFSNSNWAYIPPKKLGMDVYIGLVAISGFKTLVRKKQKVIISTYIKDIIQGTLYEFKCYERELDYLNKILHKKTFYDYIGEKVNFVINNS